MGAQEVAGLGAQAVACVGEQAVAGVGAQAVACVSAQTVACVGEQAVACVGAQAVACVGEQAVASEPTTSLRDTELGFSSQMPMQHTAHPLTEPVRSAPWLSWAEAPWSHTTLLSAVLEHFVYVSPYVVVSSGGPLRVMVGAVLDACVVGRG